MARRTDPTRHPPEAGATLLEMVFAIGAMTMVVATALAVFTLTLKNYQQDTARNTVSRSLLAAAEYMTRDLRAGGGILSTCGPYTTDQDTIVIRAPSYNDNGVIDNSCDYIIYELNGQGVLTRTVYAAQGSVRKNETGRPVVRGISALAFTYTAHEFFSVDDDAPTADFILSAPWAEQPTCRVDGVVVTEGVTYSAQYQSAHFLAPPPSTSAIEFTYSVSPGVVGALVTTWEVTFTMAAAPNVDIQGPREVTATVRLRNR